MQPGARPILFGLALALVGLRADASPLLHERIPEDPRDDILMKVTLDGDLPAAIETPSGVVSAPDPRRPVDSVAKPKVTLAAEGPSKIDPGGSGVFTADRDTHRPGLLPYDEPFSPSTAPFKRVAAYDAVDRTYRLIVARPQRTPLALHDAPLPDADAFYGNHEVFPVPGLPFRIPSVGPGARISRARFGSGARDIPFTLTHDGADNWFIEAGESGRLVLEESVPRASFGGDLGDPHASDLHPPLLPPNVLADANQVIAAIGVDRTSPRQMVQGLVSYFRSFVDSDERPTGRGNVYLDLALSKKGVCRHRAYAFTITALGLGIPARMITNEAHAWVEVYDGSLWRRIDLGGAGGELDAVHDASVVPHEAPPDPYPWPPGAERGEALGSRELGSSSSSGPGGGGATSANGATSRTAANGHGLGAGQAPASATSSPNEPATAPYSGLPSGADRPPSGHGSSEIVLETIEPDVRRGAPLKLRGSVRSEGEPCERVTVEVELRDATRGTKTSLGALATDTLGQFAGVLVLPTSVRTGDYDVVAHTAGGALCGEGTSR
jgi:transglutaminase-like putative cysteine protease